ncbi:hypothetical protein Zmor_024033 [Zophobas morio]|uniref:Uncharacterized protein n=1 Tax=Zophobas morio TaxID=2755281 RepID=A0AA38M6Y8_9CUCU|nr:hypothetical protein Zmor_024033 [Zophobas morio]
MSIVAAIRRQRTINLRVRVCAMEGRLDLVCIAPIINIPCRNRHLNAVTSNTLMCALTITLRFYCFTCFVATGVTAMDYFTDLDKKFEKLASRFGKIERGVTFLGQKVGERQKKIYGFLEIYAYYKWNWMV